MQHSRECLQRSSSLQTETATPCPSGPLGPIGFTSADRKTLNKTSAEAGTLLIKVRQKKGMETHGVSMHALHWLLFLQTLFTLRFECFLM